MTVAERIIERLNDYERAHAGDPQANVWDAVIWATGALDVDATEAEDPSARSTIAVFNDGSAVVWLEPERRWVVEVPQ